MGAGVLLLHALLLAVAVYTPRAVEALQPQVLSVTLANADARAPASPPPPRLRVQLVAPEPLLVPMVAPSITVAPEPVVSPPAAAAAAPAPAPAQVATIADLELQCPRRWAPAYPATARREREQGDVRLRVEIDEAGRISAATVVTSSGSRRLDDAAREAILQWRCDPARQHGAPVRATAYQTLSFVLTRR